MRVDKDNGKSTGRGSVRKAWWFKSGYFWRNIGLSVFCLPLMLGLNWGLDYWIRRGVGG